MDGISMIFQEGLRNLVGGEEASEPKVSLGYY
jgi:hypothetical protein